MTLPPLNLERALREALHRENPSSGFAPRVVKRARERKQRRIIQAWMAIAALLILTVWVTAGVRNHEARKQAAARKAGQDLAIALRITGHKLQVAQRMIRRRNNGA